MSLIIPVIAADGAQSTVTLADPVVGGQTQVVQEGTSQIWPAVNSGDSNTLVANNVQLPAGKVDSLSFYIDTPAGQLYLSLYDGTGPNGGPGQKLAGSPVFTPVAGWNTVATPLTVTAGQYWLCYHPSSDALKFRTNLGVGKYVAVTHAFGVPPQTFPTTGLATGAGNWSFYATMEVAATPPPPPPAGGMIQVGMYSWSEEAQTTLWPLIKTMGEPIHRFAGRDIDDGAWQTLLNIGCKVMMVAYFPTDNNLPTLAQQTGEIDRLLNRYGPGGTYWHDNPTAVNRPIEAVEIMNEPNWYLPGDTIQQKAVAYAPLLVGSYNHIRANPAWNSVQVVGVSMGDGNLGSTNIVDFLPALFNANPACAKSFDVFSFHPYTTPTPPDQIVDGTQRLDTHIAQLRQTLTNFGVPTTVPLWDTEVGYGISQANGGSEASDDVLTQAQQAAYNVRMDILSARLGVSRVYHMFDIDDDGFNGGYWNWNASANTFQTRPVAIATQHEIALLAGATALTVVSENFGGPGAFVYKFTTPNGTVQVAWAQTPKVVPIAISGTTTVTDQLGNVLATTTASSYSASLSETPIWLQSK